MEIGNSTIVFSIKGASWLLIMLAVLAGCSGTPSELNIFQNRRNLVSDLSNEFSKYEYFDGASCGYACRHISVTFNSSILQDRRLSNEIIDRIGRTIPRYMPLTLIGNSNYEVLTINVESKGDSGNILIAEFNVNDNSHGFSFRPVYVKETIEDSAANANARIPDQPLQNILTDIDISNMPKTRRAFAEYMQEGMKGEATIFTKGVDDKVIHFEIPILTKDYGQLLYMTFKNTLEELGFEFLEFSNGSGLEFAYRLFP